MQNTLKETPQYTLHRLETGAPVAADSSDLAVLHTAKSRNALNCRGFRKIRGFIKFTGGAAPTADLQTLERLQFTDPAGDDQDVFKVIRSAILSLSDSQIFEIDVGGSPVFLRVDAVAGAPTQMEVYITGTLEQTIE